MEESAHNPAPEGVWQRMRAVLLVLLLGGLGHTLVCWVALQLDFFRGGAVVFSNLFTAVWAGHLFLIALAGLGANRLLPSGDMILPVVVWSTLVLLISAYFVDQVRLCVMMILFAVLQVGVFRVRLRGFAVVSALAVLAYAAIIALVQHNHPGAIDVFSELIQWAVFTIMTIAFVILATEISDIRVQVSERNQELGQIVERIQDMAIKDELTGLYNRRHALERLYKIREMAERGAFDFVIAYVDLDHFKDVNDEYGHKVGDDVLRAFSANAQEQVSGRDFCARLGGEEFLLVLVKTDLDSAESLAQGLRARLAQARIESAPDLRVTASIGLARFRAGESLDALLARADDALYEAKEAGRDRVVRARESTA
jgi:diguanylate cyclase (GGDEF)-like protein